MDHPAVPGARAHSDFRERLQDKHITPRFRNGAGDCATDDATANDYDVRLIHVSQFIRTPQAPLAPFHPARAIGESRAMDPAKKTWHSRSVSLSSYFW
jgi:hypothetical protein